MTVYTDNPFGGMRNPAPYGGGIAGGLMNRPPPFMPQQPMPQIPRRMPGGPSKGGTTTFPPMRGPMRGPQMPPMKRPGGPGKARTGGGLMRRGRGSLMRGGPGKGRGQMQQPMPARPSFDQLMTQGPMNMPTPRVDMSQHQRPGGFGVSGPLGMPQSPFMTQQGLGQTGQIGQIGNSRPAPPPEFGQRRPQGPMNMPPMNFPQPTLRPDQTMGRPMPQPFGFDGGSFGQMRPPSNIQFQQAGNNRPAPEFMGEVGQARTQGPTSMPNTPFMIQQGLGQNLPAFPLNRGFYGGGITDLY